MVKPETLRLMIEPQLGKPGESPGFGLGFAISRLENESARSATAGRFMGSPPISRLCPTPSSASIVIATRRLRQRDRGPRCRDGAAAHAGGAREGKPLQVLETSTPDRSGSEPGSSTGHYVSGDNVDRHRRARWQAVARSVSRRHDASSCESSVIRW